MHLHQRFLEDGVQHFEQAAPDCKELLPLEHRTAPAFQAQSWVKTTGKCCDDMAVCLTVQQSPQGTPAN